MVISEYFEGQGLKIEVSDPESRRFGFEVSRVTVAMGQGIANEQVVNAVRNSKSSLIIVRANAQRTDLLTSLGQIKNTECLHADTLVYYQWDLRGLDTPKAKSENWLIRESSSLDDFANVLRESFNRYRNHYSNNPRLASNSTVVGYEEWAANLMRREDCLTLIAHEQGNRESIGFLILQVDEKRGLAEVVLNAVHPDAQRRGVYSTLMANAAERLQNLPRIETLYISTQLENQPVISAWGRLGLVPFIVLNTIHVMRNVD